MFEHFFRLFGLTTYDKKQSERNSALNMEINDISSRLRKGYPPNRDALKPLLGNRIEITGVLTRVNRGGLTCIEQVKMGKTKICDHIWVKHLDIYPMHWYYNIVTVRGKVSKYGTISFSEEIKDKYTITVESIGKTY